MDGLLHSFSQSFPWLGLHQLSSCQLNSFKRKAYIFRNPFGISKFTLSMALISGSQEFTQHLSDFVNYTNAINKTEFFKAFGLSLFITVCSVALILLCTSMCAWYVTRVKTKITKAIYILCLFSMIVPFQMVMFTLSKFANMPHLGNPSGYHLRLSGLRRRPCSLHVHGICQRNLYRN